MAARVGIYARVSKANRSGSTVSVDDQVAELRQAVATHGGTVVKVYKDRAIKASGTAKVRPEWEALLADIRADRLDVVALWEGSRSSRRLAEWATFRDLCIAHEVTWLLPDGPVDPGGRDKLAMGVGAVMAEREVDDLTKRIRRTVRAKAAEGQPHGKETYGYKRTYSPATGALVGVEIHDDEAEVVRRLVDGVLAGAGLRTLARTLNDEGLPCPADAIAIRRGREPKGHTWTGRVIRELLQSRTLVGKRVHRSVQGRRVTVAEHDAVWPALVTEEEHAALVRVLSDPARWTRADDGGRPEVRNWLSGVLRCGKVRGDGQVCGSRLRRMAVRGSESYACSDSRCRGTSIDKGKAEAAVAPIIVARLGLEDAAEALRPVLVVGLDDDARQGHLATLQGADGRLQELAQGYRAGLLSLAAYAAAEALLQEDVRVARAALRQADAPDLPEFAQDLADPAEAWESWSPSARHQVAGALFDRIQVAPVGRGRPVAGASVMPRLGFVRRGTVEPIWGVAG